MGKVVGAALVVVVLIAGAGLLLFIREFGRFIDDICPYGESEDDEQWH